MSLILTGLATVVIVLVSIYAGYGINQLVRKSNSKASTLPSETALGALMGLLAFMLAFAFSMGAGRLDDRRQFQMNEINVIGTLYLRCDLLPDEQKAQCKEVLREYVKLRVDAHEDRSTIPFLMNRSYQIQDELWNTGLQFMDSTTNKVSAMGFINATNEMIDTFGERVFVSKIHFSIAIWGALFGMTILAMLAMGYQMGQSGKSSHLLNLILAVTFSCALMMVADLDRYTEGFFVLSGEPMVDFYEMLTEER